MWVLTAIVSISLLHVVILGSSAKDYCQPQDECWPTSEEVEQFKQYLTPTGEDCHGLPTFSSVDEPGSLTILPGWN